MQITKEDMQSYRATARRRWAQDQRRLGHHHQLAWSLARQAAGLLRERFGVNRIFVFGSLVREDLFHSQSDVDLAVWGLDERKYCRAVGELLALDPEIKVDVVMLENAPVSLRATIEQEGVAL